MRPQHHAVSGLAGGAAVLLVTGSAAAAAAFALAAALLDLDHVADYLLFGARPLSLRRFLAPGDAGMWGRTVFILHSHELFLGLALYWVQAGPPLWVQAAIAGMGAHLLLDEIGNRRPSMHVRLPALFYWFVFRLSRGFRGEALLIASTA